MSHSNSVSASTWASQGWKLEHTYASLPDALHKSVHPAKFPEPRLAIVNHRLAKELGLGFGEASPDELSQLFSGQALPPGTKPIAQAYAGHQFGGFTMLGDGRAILIGEQRDPSGRLWDIQFKGSGETPYSRRGDGRAALGPMLREYIISEAMAALGIPTTRSLAVTTTGESVYRESVLPGALLTRVASSHIRVGTFQYLAAIKDTEALKALADYTIARHYPSVSESDAPYLQLLKQVIEVQARLVAQWQLVGFIHGVMNTDNTTIGGETIDYGPCAFMDHYHSGTVFSSIDHGGRYAYSNQPPILQWNLARFAETLIPLLHENQDKAIELATEALHLFPEHYEANWLAGMRLKLGLSSERAEDRELVEQLLSCMEEAELDFTNTFDDLCGETLPESEQQYQQKDFRTWLVRWEERLQSEGSTKDSARPLMCRNNPTVIPRNHRVEEALAAAENGDLAVLEGLLGVLSTPFERSCEKDEFRLPPPPGQCYRTYCGT